MIIYLRTPIFILVEKNHKIITGFSLFYYSSIFTQISTLI